MVTKQLELVEWDVFLFMQVENERLPEHETKCLAEHLYMLLSFVLSLKSGSGDLKHFPVLSSSQSNSPLLAANSLCSESELSKSMELSKSLELLGRCEALEKKTMTFENIVCVLNREVERVSLTTEAYSRQHRLDQEKIESLSNKVCNHWVGLSSTLSRAFSVYFLCYQLAKLHHVVLNLHKSEDRTKILFVPIPNPQKLPGKYGNQTDMQKVFRSLLVRK